MGHLYRGGGERAANQVAAFQSADGGWTWTASSITRDWSTESRRQSVDTPRGSYGVDDADLVRFAANGEAKVAYAAAYLKGPANRWIQQEATHELGRRTITTKPYGLAYHAPSGHLIVALGLHGVVVGMPSGGWRQVAVGPYAPTDYSLARKLQVLWFHRGLWAAASPLALAVVAVVLALSRMGADSGNRRMPAVFATVGVLVAMPLALGIAFIAMPILWSALPWHLYELDIARWSARTVLSIALIAVPTFLLWKWHGRRFPIVMAASSSIISVLPAWIPPVIFGTLNADSNNPFDEFYRPIIIGFVLACSVPSIALSWRMFR